MNLLSMMSLLSDVMEKVMLRLAVSRRLISVQPVLTIYSELEAVSLTLEILSTSCMLFSLIVSS